MSPDRFRDVLRLLNWSGRGLASVLECDERLIRRWMAGAAAIPAGIAAWLEALAIAHEANPPPADWRQRAA